MLRMIFGVLAGFIVWSILWIGSDQLLAVISPDRYGAHQNAFQAAIETGQHFAADPVLLVSHIVRAILITAIAGFVTAAVAGENRRSALILGIVLLIFGVAVQLSVWSYLPLWYHLIFLALLLPMSVLGARLKRFA